MRPGATGSDDKQGFMTGSRKTAARSDGKQGKNTHFDVHEKLLIVSAKAPGEVPRYPRVVRDRYIWSGDDSAGPGVVEVLVDDRLWQCEDLFFDRLHMSGVDDDQYAEFKGAYEFKFGFVHSPALRGWCGDW